MTGRSEAQVVRVELPSGPVGVSVDLERADDAWATMALAHGAGAGYRHPFLLGFARGMHALGVTIARFNFPYAEAGRRMPGPAAHAVSTWSAIVDHLSAGSTPVWAAGKSYGGRMASMAAAARVIDPVGLVYLGYPLHPPGDPAKARVAHLPEIIQPQLFVEGTTDPFIQPIAQLDDAVTSCQDAEVSWIDGGGHSFEVKGRKRPPNEVGADLAPLVVDWMRRRS
ncbi:alpha/beta hydrolase family protein [Microbacterium pygmaeum]|uniref:KANL3/Tex30 alpha/beta hydrolase-like domain-containing protein n=1 Tax=Microbacterium pygmaeum TaxID=370764 RepID=A0A1G7ZFU4_9MICO|nr:alpha/beta family hydrolase [Microbacterium pygmaeum]SDH07447.1 hypothetical protein SAMN04489810_2039 [Microbacterium pygmaeum]